MAQGLQPHHHEWCEHRVDNYYDDQKHCMMCGKINHERYEYKPSPFGKSLKRNKKKYGNRK